MKKPTQKLVLRSETLRTLTDADLLRAVGGLLSTTDDRSGCVVIAAAPAAPAVVVTAACG